jgi:hypothetical protein
VKVNGTPNHVIAYSFANLTGSYGSGKEKIAIVSKPLVIAYDIHFFFTW